MGEGGGVEGGGGWGMREGESETVNELKWC